MADSTTIARPYAKAIFEYALAENKLAEWSTHLQLLAQTVLTPHAAQFIENPASTTAQHIDLLQEVIKKGSNQSESINNLISLLANNKRLSLLPEISALYEVHRAEQEKTLDVEVSTFSDLSNTQKERLEKSLSKRLQRNVSLKINIDPSLLGGAIIQAGDLVIDGSVRGKLHKLITDLAA